MTKTDNIIIYGSGGLGRGIIDLINSINKHTDESWILKGFVDDANTGMVNGYAVLGGIEYLLNYTEKVNVVLAFGSPAVKKKLFDKLKYKENITFPNIIHPNVEVSPFNKFGKGNIVSSGVALSTNIQINDFNLIHYNCSIGHDVSMGSFNSVYPLTALSGFVVLGEEVEVGTNAAVIPSKKIGSEAKIGAGSVVVDDVMERKTVVGVPGKAI
ncbi:NeuD/PglB/VioB family sugar acetyltransferase [Virgibacillus sp. CBA3643]|uniref:NeuD/PglB/VioB family sugar acetyltransferase n=1 Tax=Virgibacillus sp. CBA3643 TaxID=2942278 RepID=UPI0035A32E3A